MGWYNYSLIQYVGDPVRQEAINLGIAVVDPATSETRVFVDGNGFRHIQRLWPDADARVLRAFARDVAAELRSPHQRFLGEPPIGDRMTTSRQLDDIRTRNVNQFRLLPPATWRSTDLSSATRELYRRFVERQVISRPRQRHMTRADLRNLVSQIFGEWASGRQGIVIELDTVLEGARAPHTADVVLLTNSTPRVAAVTVPTSGQGRQLGSVLRDSLPSLVADLRSKHPEVRVYAVFPDNEQAPAQRDDLTPEAFRSYLADVEGLRIARVKELKDEFSDATVFLP